MAILGHRHSRRALHSWATENALLSRNDPADSSKGGTSSILVAGLVIIGICVAMLLAGLIRYCYRRRIAKKAAASGEDECSSQ